MRRKMAETDYRASRICRVLGNPTAYQIIKTLLGTKKKPTEIAQELGLSLPNVSSTLRTLRNVDLVRYDTVWKEKIYWIKQKTLTEVCKTLETMIIQLRHKM